jgi:hypothetical protein
MRNTTKLKAILYKYMVSFDLNEDELFIMTISGKYVEDVAEFQAKSYSMVISKAYSYFLRELKREENALKSDNQDKN